MGKKVPELIHELSKICFEKHFTLSIESITDEKGKNKIEFLNDVVNIKLYSSDEDNEGFAAELNTLINGLRTIV